MTSEQMEALGRRVVRLAGWYWRPGMLVSGERAGRALPGVAYRLSDKRHPSFPGEYDWPHDIGLRIPDLADPATVGCLLALVREAWGQRVSCVPLAAGQQWHALFERNLGGGLVVGSGASEAEALVAALEAAEKRL